MMGAKKTMMLDSHRELLRTLRTLRKTLEAQGARGPDSLKKIGLDVHGVITETPEYLAVRAKSLVDAGHQVHIMTGTRVGPRLVDELAAYGFHKSLNYTHIFSITDHLISTGIPVDFRDDLPFADGLMWDAAKGEYATMVGLDCLWDDSPVYGHYMPADCWYFTYSAEKFEAQLSQVLHGGRPQVGRK